MTNKQTAPADARAALDDARRITHDLSTITPAHACAWRAYVGLTDETPSPAALEMARHAASALHNFAALEFVSVNPTLSPITRAQIITQCAALRTALDTYNAR